MYFFASLKLNSGRVHVRIYFQVVSVISNNFKLIFN